MATGSSGRRPLLGRGCRWAPLGSPASGAYRPPPDLLSPGPGVTGPVEELLGDMLYRAVRSWGLRCPQAALPPPDWFPAAWPCCLPCPTSAPRIGAPATCGDQLCGVTEAVLTRTRPVGAGPPFKFSTAFFYGNQQAYPKSVFVCKGNQKPQKNL